MSIIGNGIILGAGGEKARIFVTGLSNTDTVTCIKDSKSFKGKWVQNQKPNPEYMAPSGYTQLEYVESTGTQYINTGFIPSANGYIARGKFMYSNLNNNWSGPLGLYGGSTSNSGKFGRYRNTNNWSTCFGGADNQSSYTLDTNIKYVFDVSFISGNHYLNINGVDVIKTAQTQSIKSIPVWLFSYNYNESFNSNESFAGRIYYAKIYDHNNTLIRDFIPVKRNSDNAIGMYDLVTSTFFINSGTGEFIAGAEVPFAFGSSGFEFAVNRFGIYTITVTNGTSAITRNIFVDAIAIFEIPIRDIDKNVLLLIDGNNIKDISTYQRSITNTGVTLSNAQTKFFDKSLYFNGSAILQFDTYTLGTGDFTIDFWMYNTATSNAYRRWITGNNGYFVDGTFCLRESGDGLIQTHNVTSSTSVPRNQWVHIATVRSNGTLKIYLNGTEIASISDSTNYSEALKYIGGYYSSIGDETFQGYMDEIRVSNVARWTSNFTPPGRPY